MENNSQKIFFCLVNYKTTAEIILFIEQAYKSKIDANFFFIIVDNSEKKHEEIEIIKQKKTNLIYYINNSNTGYLNGLGKALDIGIEKWGLPDWAIFSNSDIKINFPVIINSLTANHLEENIGLWSCGIISSQTQKNQNPFLIKRPSKYNIIFYRYILGSKFSFIIYTLLHNLKIKYLKNQDDSFTHNHDVYALHGSFFCLSKKFIKSVVQIRWESFLYAEEIWFAEQCRIHKLRVVLNKQNSIIHEEHKSTSLINSKQKSSYYRQSFDFLYKKFWR